MDVFVAFVELRHVVEMERLCLTTLRSDNEPDLQACMLSFFSSFGNELRVLYRRVHRRVVADTRLDA